MKFEVNTSWNVLETQCEKLNFHESGTTYHFNKTRNYDERKTRSTAYDLSKHLMALTFIYFPKLWKIFDFKFFN